MKTIESYHKTTKSIKALQGATAPKGYRKARINAVERLEEYRYLKGF